MREIEYCMRYANTCKRCPLNRICEVEYQREMEQKSGDADGHGDLSILWDSSKRTPMQAQEKPNKKHRHPSGEV